MGERVRHVLFRQPALFFFGKDRVVMDESSKDVLAKTSIVGSVEDVAVPYFIDLLRDRVMVAEGQIDADTRQPNVIQNRVQLFARNNVANGVFHLRKPQFCLFDAGAGGSAYMQPKQARVHAGGTMRTIKLPRGDRETSAALPAQGARMVSLSA